MTPKSSSRSSTKRLPKSPRTGDAMDRLTDVIQKPAVAFRTIQVLRTIVEEQEKEIERLKARKYTFERGPDPYRDATAPPAPEIEPTHAQLEPQCGKQAPASKACRLGPHCLCVQVEGHTTPHRAKCGARWANRKRS